jgi:hypothetical protein
LLIALGVSLLILVLVDPGAAPHDVNRPVHAGPLWPAFANSACRADHGVQSLVYQNSTSGVALYTVTCVDGAAWTIGD